MPGLDPSRNPSPQGMTFWMSCVDTYLDAGQVVLGHLRPLAALIGNGGHMIDHKNDVAVRKAHNSFRLALGERLEQEVLNHTLEMLVVRGKRRLSVDGLRSSAHHASLASNETTLRGMYRKHP